MSRKPYIKIVYPDASQIAMLLTEAMVRRASGKRVVETESAEREHVGQDLFAGTLCCVTETSVELTLNLAPEAMDFALATLIAKNLTQSERDKAMAASDSLELDALFSPPSQAAAAPGQALDGSSSPDVPSAEQEAATQSGEQEEKIEIGKVSEKALRDILNEMIDTMEKGHGTFNAINHAVYEITKNSKSPVKLAESWVPQKIAAVLQAAGCSKKSKTLDPFARGLIVDLEKTNKEDEYYISLSVLVALVKTMAESKGNDPFALYSVFGGETASWDEIEREARKIGQHKTDKADKTDKTDEDAADQEIEPGLLNDIEDGEEGGQE